MKQPPEHKLRRPFCCYVKLNVVSRNQVFGLQSAFLRALCKFGSCGKENVTGAVERSFASILQYGDDKANTNNLHSDIIADAEGAQATGISSREPRQHRKHAGTNGRTMHSKRAVGSINMNTQSMAAASASTEMVMEARPC